jgi:predicted kinase
MKKQFVIILEGPMGSGKTTISSLLHSKLPRTALLGMDKIKWFLSDFQRVEDYDLVSRVMLGMCKTFLEQGCNLLIEQAFWKKEYVQPYIDLTNEFKADLHFYQLEAPEDVLKKRAQGRPNTPQKPPVTTGRIDENLKKWQENRYEFGKNIDTEKLSPEEVVQLILQDVI